MLHIDFESRSPLDLKKVGLDVYARSATPLMMAYAEGGDAPRLWVMGEVFPRELFENSEATFAAYNAGFERAILLRCFDLYTPPSRWVDVPNLVRYATIPPKLKEASKYLQIGDSAKNSMSFAKTKKDPGSKFSRMNRKGRFVEPEEAPDDWETFKEYCKQDVVAEREILLRLQKTFALTPFEQRVAQLDTRINERGIPVDMRFVREASRLVSEEKIVLRQEITALTGVENPNSNSQMLEWLRQRGYPFNSLLKKRVDKAMAGELPPETRRALELRAKLSRSSTAKLDAIVDRVSPDGRLRGSYVYLGASRTGRWSGSGVQLQNLPR